MHGELVLDTQLFEHGDHIDERNFGTDTAITFFEQIEEQLLTIRHGATFQWFSASHDYGPERVGLLGPRDNIDDRVRTSSPPIAHSDCGERRRWPANKNVQQSVTHGVSHKR